MKTKKCMCFKCGIYTPHKMFNSQKVCELCGMDSSTTIEALEELIGEWQRDDDGNQKKHEPTWVPVTGHNPRHV